MEFPCFRRAASPPGDRSPRPEQTAALDKRRSRRAALPLWRPSLGSISEDGTSVAEPTTPAAVKNGGAGRRMAKPKPQAVKVASRTGKDVNMQGLHFGALPTFAPTAFLF